MSDFYYLSSTYCSSLQLFSLQRALKKDGIPFLTITKHGFISVSINGSIMIALYNFNPTYCNSNCLCFTDSSEERQDSSSSEDSEGKSFNSPHILIGIFNIYLFALHCTGNFLYIPHECNNISRSTQPNCLKF